MSGYTLTDRTSLDCPAPARRKGWITRLVATLRAFETRRQLEEMDARMLSDIGISRAEAMMEARRAPWDLGPRGC